MSDLNSFNCTGRLARDPQARATPAGQAICEFSLAIGETYKDKAGKTIDKVCFLDCTAWGRLAEIIAEHQHKGDQVALGGKLVQDTWEDKNDGSKRSKIKLNVDHLTMLQKAKSEGGRNSQKPQQRQPQSLQPEDDFYSSDDSGFYDDTPF